MLSNCVLCHYLLWFNIKPQKTALMLWDYECQAVRQGLIPNGPDLRPSMWMEWALGTFSHASGQHLS